MEKQTGTIFKVYLLDKTSPKKQEGFIKLWKHKGKLQNLKYLPFDYLDEIPQNIRRILKSAKITWPKAPPD